MNHSVNGFKLGHILFVNYQVLDKQFKNLIELEFFFLITSILNNSKDSIGCETSRM